MPLHVPLALFASRADARDAIDALMAYGIPSVMGCSEDQIGRAHV